MRTTILFSMLLAASRLLAQDSPILVADSGISDDLNRKGATKGAQGGEKKAAKKTIAHAIYIRHEDSFPSATTDPETMHHIFKFNKNSLGGHYLAACLEVKGAATPDRIIQLASLKNWKVVLNDGIEIRSNGTMDSTQIHLDVMDKTHNDTSPGNPYHELTLSGESLNKLTVYATDANNNTTPTPFVSGAIVFHYCKNGWCGVSYPCVP